MKTIAAFLLKVLVKQFYIINAGFLFFLFFFFFGMVNGGQLISYHKSLILATISSPVIMGIVWLAWLFYNVKCILFCTNTMNATDSSFIFNLRALSNSKQIILYLLVNALVYLPVLVYSCFVVFMAINQSTLQVGILVIVYQLVMITSGAWILFLTINKIGAGNRFEKIIAGINKLLDVKIGYKGFLLAYILHTKKLAFTLVKIFSILLLTVSFVINGDQFDKDLFGIFFLLIFVGHAILVFYCVDFAETQLQFNRNLPIGLLKIAGMYLFTYSIVLLPEVAFMLINNHGNLPTVDIVILYLTAISTLFLCTSILYGCGLNMEGYLLFVFIAFIMIFFLQKMEMHLMTLLAILVTGAAIFKSYYYSFERD